MRKISEERKTQISKLPKWARDHIKNINQERDAAVTALDNFCNEEKQSPFYVEDFICDGVKADEHGIGGPSNRRRYVQTNRIEVEHAGVYLSVLLRADTIELSWDSGRKGLEDIVLQPKSFQMVSLFVPGATKQR